MADDAGRLAKVSYDRLTGRGLLGRRVRLAEAVAALSTAVAAA